MRNWRLRSRKGQVSAVATILGLLLVVTYIANYLSTTLPSQMGTNDLDHVIQVENQLGQFQALLEQYSAAGAIGAPVTQPVTLGSQGLPPFADADSGSVGPLNGSSYSLSYVLTGPTAFSPPSTGTPGGFYPTKSCTYSSSSAVVELACSSKADVTYNFTGTPSEEFLISISAGGTFALNFSTSGTASANEMIDVDVSAAAPLNVYVLGSNDTVNLDISTASTINLVEYGSNDTVKITNAAVTSAIDLYAVGYADSASITSGPDLTFDAYFFGADDSVAMASGTSAATTSTTVLVYFVGFTSATTACPSDNLATTDSVSGSNTKGTYTAYYNVTTKFTPATVTDWNQYATVVATPSSASCPFFVTVTVSPETVRYAGLNVHLLNTYAPEADIALDAGAVLYAQPGGTPLVIDPPGLSVVRSGTTVTSVSIWVPTFLGSPGSQSGIGTAELSARLIAVSSIVLTPSSSYSVADDSDITLSVITPFAAGWWSYFNSTYPASWIGCTGAGCNGPYSGLGDYGNITLTIPTGTDLNYFDLDVATFAFQPL